LNQAANEGNVWNEDGLEFTIWLPYLQNLQSWRSPALWGITIPTHLFCAIIQIWSTPRLNCTTYLPLAENCSQRFVCYSKTQRERKLGHDSLGSIKCRWDYGSTRGHRLGRWNTYNCEHWWQYCVPYRQDCCDEFCRDHQ